MNYRKGKFIIIGADKQKKGVMMHISVATYAEAKKYDKKLTEKDFDKLLF